MNEKAIFEIGSIIHARYKLWGGGGELTAEEITETFEYERFKKDHPELCRLAGDK